MFDKSLKFQISIHKAPLWPCYEKSHDDASKKNTLQFRSHISTTIYVLLLL